MPNRGIFPVMIMFLTMSCTFRLGRSFFLARPSSRGAAKPFIRPDPHSAISARSKTAIVVSESSSPSTNPASDSRDSVASAVTPTDGQFLAQAVECARMGWGHTYPNPAVGCVLVRQDTDEVIGRGFHPRAGYPHAEIFALLEAAGHVESGVEAARSVLEAGRDHVDGAVQALADLYASPAGDGPGRLFERRLADVPVTAYVTLEPCCHYGRTPPCAATFALAAVDRVVVGFRDPNPRVDGGGVAVLRQAGIEVTMATDALERDCADLVECFVKRILPKEYDSIGYSHVNGAMRRGLRSLSGRKKNDGTLVQVNWTARVAAASSEAEVDELELEAKWMERLDAVLWKEEMVNLRLSKVVSKRKLSKRLAERIASSLGAHVAQSVGHTALLYRPGVPPVIDLEELENGSSEKDSVDVEL